MDAAAMRTTLDVERARGLELVAAAATLGALDEARTDVLGRKAPFSDVQRSLGQLEDADRRELGTLANEVRQVLASAFATRRAELEHAAEASLLDADRLDLSLPGRAAPRGSLHPLTHVEDEIVEVFTRMGFTVAEGPEIEDDWHNFQALNIPPDHPARTMKDSLYVAIPGHPELLLRTETSAVQIRTMQRQPPPVYVIAPGRVYRRETADATHLPVFSQVEGLVVDEGITFADMKGTLEEMARGLFGETRRVRLGPAYFPFVEPGAEVGVSCFLCDGAGCRVCGNGWIELLGAGMVHPQVLENCGYDAERYTGFAFGLGIERVALLRYAIPDMRLLVDADPRFLSQWGAAWWIPLSWLREVVPTDMAADELAEMMTHRGVKVEGLLDPWGGLDGVVVARVLEVRDHPGSDKLCVARLQHGAGEVELVVGVRNMAPGDVVPWAPPGARVPALGEPLGQRTIRGVVSDGMLCSSRELGLSQDHGGILVLDEPGWDVGADVKRTLGLHEPVLDIEVEPNRPDFLSIHGVAREVAAATGVAMITPEPSVEELDERAEEIATVRIDAPDRCPRYVARIIRGVTAAASPLTIQARLTACGMRPIAAVVDATNYVMLERGQPMHGFDLDRLAGPGIVVRLAREEERLTTLDDEERSLTPDDLFICDIERPVAIAGVMGGRSTEVDETTTDVLLESASFTRGGVLLTARRLGLHSEASYRFERGTDPEAVEDAATRCAALIGEWTGARVAAGVAAAGSAPERRWVAVRPARATRLLGYEVTAQDAGAVFDVLGMRHRGSGDAIEVEVPGYRTDIDREVDLIEEIVRIQGYERVGSTRPRAPQAGGVPAPYAFARRAKDALVRAGLREIGPIPFASQEDLDLFEDHDAVAVANPLRQEEGFLRTRLTPGLLHAAARSQALGGRRVALFEVGITFRRADPFAEHRKAGFVLAGPSSEAWDDEDRELDVLHAKGVVGSLCEELGVAGWTLGDPPSGPFHPGRSAQVLAADRPVGVVGEIHPAVALRLGIDGRVAVGVVGLGALEDASSEGFTFRDVPRFPPLRRDLAFIVAESTPAGAVRDAIVAAAAELADGCELFDVYRGPAIPEGTKSLAFTLALRAPDRTLTDEEAAPLVDAIAHALRQGFGAELRTA